MTMASPTLSSPIMATTIVPSGASTIAVIFDHHHAAELIGGRQPWAKAAEVMVRTRSTDAIKTRNLVLVIRSSLLHCQGIAGDCLGR